MHEPLACHGSNHRTAVYILQTDAVRRQLDSGNVVLLSNLGYSAAGEVLNCDTYTVATRAAVDLQVRAGTEYIAWPNWGPSFW